MGQKPILHQPFSEKSDDNAPGISYTPKSSQKYLVVEDPHNLERFLRALQEN
jgi:hypothetical protein